MSSQMVPCLHATCTSGCCALQRKLNHTSLSDVWWAFEHRRRCKAACIFQVDQRPQLSRPAECAVIPALVPMTWLQAQVLMMHQRHRGGHRETRPKDGRKPTTLQCPDGPLTELPVSVPSPARAKLAATPARATCPVRLAALLMRLLVHCRQQKPTAPSPAPRYACTARYM